MSALLRTILILVYSLLLTVLAPLAARLARLSPKLRIQIEGRLPVSVLARDVARARARYRHAVVFYCSSAGEFEQARPLVERLEALRTVYVHVIFFSKSGLDFVKAQKDNLPCSLSPATDSVWHWGWLFAALRPDIVAVIRHELWPGFLDTARHYGQLCLIDASRSIGETGSWMKRLFRGQFLRAFDTIYTVTQADLAFFRNDYRLPAARLKAVGDTKYDRVRERAVARAGEAKRLTALFGSVAGGADVRRLVLGSAYRQEVELLLAARTSLGERGRAWQVIIVPHQVTPEMVSWVRGRCEEAGLKVVLYSALAAAAPSESGGTGAADVIVVDAMGLLAEIYGAGTAALVGGGLHHQVHNVLEPAVRGLALAFGPFYKNSQEAVHLVQVGLAAVVDNAAALADWWQRLDSEDCDLAARMTAAVAELAGASDRIMADWRPRLGS